MTKALEPVVKKKRGGPQEGSGRPKLQLDEDLLFKLGESMLPFESIAKIMDCHVDTLQVRYSVLLQKAREGRKKALSTAMWEKALIDKDCKMQIWLSKQHLGYKDTMPEGATQVIFNVMINEVPK